MSSEPGSETGDTDVMIGAVLFTLITKALPDATKMLVERLAFSMLHPVALPESSASESVVLSWKSFTRLAVPSNTTR